MVARSTRLHLVLLVLFTLSLAACGGGGGSSSSTPTTASSSILGGGAVKGPLANAILIVYAFDPTQPSPDSRARLSRPRLPLVLTL